MRALFGWLMVFALIACGHNSGSTNADGSSTGGGDDDGSVNAGGDAGGNGGAVDGGSGSMLDAPPAICTPGTTQCSDCIDNDLDGKIDGFDAECTGPLDNREDTFATGIPGDNIDTTWQDCFFDGNSGAGNDGCNQHVCCLLQAPNKGACPISANQYSPSQCYQPFGTTPVPQKCGDVCGPLTPPGCDCFGCCTVCNEQGCADIVLNPAVSPQCDQSTILDPTKCAACVKNTMCGSAECGGQTCILCPGQDPSSLPSSCSGQVCPDGIQACDANGGCPTDTYCSNGCCIGTLF